MKKIIFIFFAAVICAASCNVVTAFKTGEYVDSERNVKICVYETMGKNYFSSVATYGLCPLNIKVCQRF